MAKAETRKKRDGKKIRSLQRGKGKGRGKRNQARARERKRGETFFIFAFPVRAVGFSEVITRARGGSRERIKNKKAVIMEKQGETKKKWDDMQLDDVKWDDVKLDDVQLDDMQLSDWDDISE